MAVHSKGAVGRFLRQDRHRLDRELHAGATSGPPAAMTICSSCARGAAAAHYAPMTTKHDRLRIRDIEAERIVIREPNGGRVRVVIETGPPRPGMERPPLPSARVTLLDGRGNPAFVAEVDADGDACLFIGPPDAGTTAVLTPGAIDLWRAGDIVAALRSDDTGGLLELFDDRGRARRQGRGRRA